MAYTKVLDLISFCVISDPPNWKERLQQFLNIYIYKNKFITTMDLIGLWLSRSKEYKITSD